MQRLQEILERPPAEGAPGGGLLAGGEGRQALLLKNTLGFVRKQHRVAIEGEAHFVGIVERLAGGQQGRGREAVLQGTAHVIGVGGEEQIAAKGAHIAVGAAAVTEGSPGDVQAVVFDGVEDPQPGIRRVA